MRPSGRIGVLALQGDVEEHLQALRDAGEPDAVPVTSPDEIRGLRGLILPGGESTTVGKLMTRWGVDVAIREEHARGMALFGTCTGMILLATRIEGSDQPRLGLMEITVRRNAFGRQVDSFEADLDIPLLGPPPARGVFIRAPIVIQAGPGVEVRATVEPTAPEPSEAPPAPCSVEQKRDPAQETSAVLVREGRCLAAAFHPELAGERRIHRLFLEMTEK